MASNSRSATDMVDQAQYIDLKEISVDFIKTRPTSDLELVFKDDAGVKYKSNKFKNDTPVLWNPDIHVRTHTSATLIIRRALFKIRVADISVKFEPYNLGDSKVVRLEDTDRCVTVTFVYGKPKPLAGVTRVLGSRPTFSNTVILQHRHGIPEVQFRVLIIGRANAGKTSILQRICETTESPVIYRGMEKVRLDPSMDRGEHTIDDELVFSNNNGYVFHDSRGIESGSTEELGILQEFVRRKCGERRLRDRLHAIWYCVPMDNQRPQLDLRFFKDICPDGNVPVVVVFTKYDQFWKNVRIYVEDFGSPDDNIFDVAEKQFQQHYLLPLGDDVKFVRLEKMHRQNMGCNRLIETTAAALNDNIVGLMLLAVQKGNLELSVKRALNRVRSRTGMDVERIVRECLFPFPYIWWLSSKKEFKELSFKEKEKLKELEKKENEEYEKEFLKLSERCEKEGLKLSEEGESSSHEHSLEESLEFEFESLLYLEERSEFLEYKKFDRLVEQIMSFPTIQNLTPTNLGGYHLISAVIVILKHATFLRLSNMSAKSTLTHAEVDYRKANIDSKIQQHLTAPSQEHSDESFAGFIMSIDLSSVENTFA